MVYFSCFILNNIIIVLLNAMIEKTSQINCVDNEESYLKSDMAVIELPLTCCWKNTGQSCLFDKVFKEYITVCVDIFNDSHIIVSQSRWCTQHQKIKLDLHAYVTHTLAKIKLMAEMLSLCVMYDR